MIDDFDDILGEPPPSFDLREVTRGVSISWLANVFRMNPNTVKRRLANCPPIGLARGNNVIFDVKQAAQFLVDPKVDIEKYIKSLRTDDLPQHLQGEFWDSRLKKLRWEREAGESWRTPDVLDVFSDTFKIIREQMQMWTTNMDRVKELTPQQRSLLNGMVDTLQKDIHRQLIELPQKRETKNVYGQEKEIGEGDVPL